MERQNELSEHLHPTVRDYVGNRTIAESYDEYFGDMPLFKFDCQFIDSHLSPPGRVIDLGCGTGRHLVHLAQRGFRTLGVDLNPYMLRRARENMMREGFKPELLQADFHMLNLSLNDMFDGALFMFSTLGLVRTTAMRIAVLQSVRAYLTDDAVVVAHFHNKNFNRPFRKLFADALVTVRDGGEPGDHVMPNYRGIQDLFLHSFTEKEIVGLFSNSGYAISDLVRLNGQRDGEYSGDNPETYANGFLVAARKN